MKENKFLENIGKITSFITDNIMIFGMISITTIVFLTTMLRYFFGMSFIWAEEVCRAIIIWIVFFGVEKCLRDGTHVNMDIVLKRIPEGKFKYILIRLIVFVSFIFSIFLIRWGIVLTKSVWATGQVTPTLRIPMYIVYLGMPIGSFLLSISFLRLLLLKLKPTPNVDFKVNDNDKN